MREARMLGNYVEHLAEERGLSISDLSRILDCSEHQVYGFVKGRNLASFAQISKLATALDMSIDNLLSGNNDIYNSSIVHCMNGFQDDNNREFILDLIDSYVDVADAIALQ